MTANLTSQRTIALIGASGHGKVVADIIEKAGRDRVVGFVDANPQLHGTEVYGYPVLGDERTLMSLPDDQQPDAVIVSIGHVATRMRIAATLREAGYPLATAVHPSALIAKGVELGAGTVVMAGAAINADTRVGDNVIINTRASVDHDCVIGDGVHIAPGAVLCGTVTVGMGSFVAAGSTVIPNLTIGAKCVVGAGAVVIRDVPERAVVVGNPARAIR